MKQFIQLSFLAACCFVAIFFTAEWIGKQIFALRSPKLDSGFSGSAAEHLQTLGEKELSTFRLNRAGTRGVGVNKSSSLFLWEEFAGWTELSKEIVGEPVISSDGTRVAYLTSGLELWEEGFDAQTIFKKVRGPWELQFSGNGNTLALIPQSSDAAVEALPTGKTILLHFGSRFSSAHLKKALPQSTLPVTTQILNTDAGIIRVGADFSFLQNSSPTRQQLRSPQRVQNDIDGDGASDILTFAPGKELPFWRAYTSGGYNGAKKGPAGVAGESFTWRIGDNTGVPIPGDYNGDGILDFATYTPRYSQNWSGTHGNWRIFLSEAHDLRKRPPFGPLGEYRDFSWGLNTMVAVPADYDGDGADDLAVFDMQSHGWHFIYSAGGFHMAKAELQASGKLRGSKFGEGIPFGIKGGAIPVVADYSGDGKADLALFQSPSSWKIRLNKKEHLELQLGQAGDIPIPLDFDCDGRANPGVYRPSEGVWLFYVEGREPYRVSFGDRGKAEPFSGDFDGDGCQDLALYYPERPQGDHWHFLPSKFRREALREIPVGKNIDVRLIWPAYPPVDVVLREHYQDHLEPR